MSQRHPVDETQSRASASADNSGAVPSWRGTTAEHLVWDGLRNPSSTDVFYASWLALLCGGIRSASAGLLVLKSDDDRFLRAAQWPEQAGDIARLVPAAEQAIAVKRPVVVRNTAQTRRGARALLAHPVLNETVVIGAVVVELSTASEADGPTASQQIEWALGWPEAMVWRERAAGRDQKDDTARLALEILTEADKHERFDATAITVANVIARRFACERVSIGFVRSGAIHVAAVSHSIQFDKRSDLAKGLEAVMQEAYDQYGTVVSPSLASITGRIAVAHADFRARWDISAILSVVLTAVGRPIGILTLERAGGSTYTPVEIEQVKAIANTAGPIMHLRWQQDRMISGRLSSACLSGLTMLAGPERPALRIGAAAIALTLAVMAFWPAQLRVVARTVIEGEIQRVAAAPFDGFIAQSTIRAGAFVSTGAVLATLDDRDLQLDKLKWETERQKLVQRQREAAAKHDRVDVLIIGAQIEQAQSQLELALEKLRRTRITAPIDGVVVTGDLTQMLGAPVTQGKVLFEIAPLSAYRLILQVDERDVSLLEAGQRGQLVLTGSADRNLGMEITRTFAVATAEDGRNVFRMEGRLIGDVGDLRPGMEGVAKIEAAKSTLLRIWSRPITDRIKYLVWAWTP